MRTALLLALVCAGTVLYPAPRAPADTATPITISEVYAGGGAAGASYQNDFVELFNRTRYAVDLTGWRIAYSPPRSASWTTVSLSGSLSPYRYYLVAFGSSGAAGVPLPRPDAAGTANLARSSGEIALFNTSLQRVDLVGYGPDADVYEGRPAPAGATNAQSVTRVPSPCSDSDRNDVDFRIKSPTPKNRASSGYACP